ncbi:MAG: porphobilinogen synthase [Nitrospirota bacterium]|nr:porphobilinogen synthase [Nitrospirota bacterium]
MSFVSMPRPRRLRRTESLRRMVRETRLSPDDFIYPLFAVPGEGVKNEVVSMPGVYQMSVDQIARECEEVRALGIPAVILFGIPEHKDATGSGAWDDNGVVQQAVRAIKKTVPELTVITDVCLCEYTDHGHCGVIRDTRGEQQVDNDPTVQLLVKEAVSHARAGADIVAPSDMMDGRVAAIREGLDKGGFEQTPILSYSTKFASAYYGPFRDAADSTPQFGDRRSYQMDPANAREAVRETLIDLEEGADMVMVKPALAYLDILRAVREVCDVPLAAYNVSGEYAMVKAAARAGWIDGDRVMLETLLAMRRAGADLILTYHAKEAARLLA